MELTETIIGAIALAFTLGIGAGWVLKPNQTIAVTSPDFERAKTLAEARSSVVTNEIEGHLAEIEEILAVLAAKQSALVNEIRGENASLSPTAKKLPAENSPPRDYAESRGQLL
ncbi:hypothetical protein N8005_02075 [Litorivicinus sp.]|nr:hypothetical protein [Litorivicinus sp.]MDC1208103.1 hypothetical protein [Litorivicinus sp.]MDC1466145.1 hypothetical protein [Litorivicinus sp.]